MRTRPLEPCRQCLPSLPLHATPQALTPFALSFCFHQPLPHPIHHLACISTATAPPCFLHTCFAVFPSQHASPCVGLTAGGPQRPCKLTSRTRRTGTPSCAFGKTLPSITRCSTGPYRLRRIVATGTLYLPANTSLQCRIGLRPAAPLTTLSLRWP